MPCRDGGERHEAHIVALARMGRTRVAEPHEEKHDRAAPRGQGPLAAFVPARLRRLAFFALGAFFKLGALFAL